MKLVKKLEKFIQSLIIMRLGKLENWVKLSVNSPITKINHKSKKIKLWV